MTQNPSTLFISSAGEVVQLTTSPNATPGMTYIAQQGGGFVRGVDNASFARDYKPYSFPAPAAAKVAGDWAPDMVLQCFTNGELWNGWAKPLFPFDQAMRIVDECKEMEGSFDAGRDAFVFPCVDDTSVEPEVFAGSVIQVDGRPVKVYGVGAGSWCWWTVE